MVCSGRRLVLQLTWADVLSTQSTREPEVVNGINESITQISRRGQRNPDEEIRVVCNRVVFEWHTATYAGSSLGNLEIKIKNEGPFVKKSHGFLIYDTSRVRTCALREEQIMSRVQICRLRPLGHSACEQALIKDLIEQRRERGAGLATQRLGTRTCSYPFMRGSILGLI